MTGLGGKRVRTTAAAAIILLAAGAGRAEAQQTPRPWSFDARAGLGIPTGSLADLGDVGPAFGVGVAYEVRPRVAVRVDGDLSLYGGADFEAVDAKQDRGPDVSLWHLTASAEVELTDPARGLPWRITAIGGLGATVFDVDRFQVGVDNPRTGEEDVREFDQTALTLASGIRAAYELAPGLDAFGDLRWFLAFTDEDETAVFTEMSGTEVSPFSSASSFPLTVGVRARF